MLTNPSCVRNMVSKATRELTFTNGVELRADLFLSPGP